MNRQQRRQMEKKRQKIRLEDRVYNEMMRREAEFNTETLNASTLLVLHRVFGFGKKRCIRFLDALNEFSEKELIHGDMTHDDLLEAVKTEVHIRLESLPAREAK